MSFMFNPYPYSDPKAVNPIEVDKSFTDMIEIDSVNSAKKMIETAIEKNAKVIGIDGFIGAPFSETIAMLKQSAAIHNIDVTAVSCDILYKESEALEEMLDEYLSIDLEKDPVLLYGSLYKGNYEGLMKEKEIDKLHESIDVFKKNGNGLMIIYGNGALIVKLKKLCDISIFIDVTPIKVVLNAKEGKIRNLGDDKARAYKALMRRCYYVDFELSMDMRGELLRSDLDFYVQGDNPAKLQLVPMECLNAIFDSIIMYPLRCKPVYLEGIWGGHYMSKIRNLPKEMKNCAWIFDMIPLEVSVVTSHNDKTVEFPFFALVQARGKEILGNDALKKFGGYFPIRFNYDDTWHAGGNMSIQVHPDHDYVISQNGEKGRQDESYYVVQTGQDAKTYMGFNEDIDVEDFLSEVRRSEKDGVGFDYEKYVNSVESKPGRQFMIPAGTIHSSGRNQVVLEIGSLTIGSYTYKLYDYMRTDYDGKPRPIHSYHGDKVLKRERKESWILDNVVQSEKIIREGRNWKESVVGLHDLLYFTLRTLTFEEKIQDDTKDVFHVLSLVDGEKVRIQSLEDPNKFFIQEYLDVIVVPHNMGEYEIINLGDGSVTIHKTLLKDGFIND